MILVGSLSDFFYKYDQESTTVILCNGKLIQRKKYILVL